MADKKQLIVAREESSFIHDTCCCCIPLKTGCFILGYLQLIGITLCGIYFAAIICTYSPLFNYVKYNRTTTLLFNWAAIMLLLVLVSLPFAIILLIGLHKERRKHIKIYLIFGVTATVLDFIAAISLNCICIFYGRPLDLLDYLLPTLKHALMVYFLLVVRSQYIKMGKAEGLPSANHKSDFKETIKV